MLYVTQKNEAPYPVLCCDVCHQAIERLALAEAVFPSAFIAGGQLARLLLVHRDTCLAEALATLQAQVGAGDSMTFQDYLELLRDRDSTLA